MYAPYKPPKADIWALGLILLSICCPGFLPWDKASINDPNFANYIAHRDNFFLASFPISNQLSNLLKRTLELEPEKRLTISDMKRDVRRIDSFLAAPGTSAQDTAGLYETFAGVMKSFRFINLTR